MISNDKQFEYLGSQVKKHVQRSIEAFKLFLQTQPPFSWRQSSLLWY